MYDMKNITPETGLAFSIAAKLKSPSIVRNSVYDEVINEL